jgi:glyoxylate reductase
MSKPKVYVTRRIPDAGLKLLRDACDVRMWEGDTPPPRETLLAAVREVEGVLALLSETINGELMDAAPNLKVVSNFAVGYDNIDVSAATARGIPVGNTPGVLTETTADLAFALLLSAARRLGESERYVHEGKWKTWSPTLLLGQDVFGATLGILGFGRIGQATARRGKGFGMRILYHGGSEKAAAQEIGAEERSLDDLLKASDFISVHTPLNDETYHLIDARALALMKPTAILVNTARGGIIDPAALYAALKNGTIGGAALDVTEPEPVLMNDPLLTLDNCTIVPHIGSASVATRDKMAEMSARNLLAGVCGERLLYCVNPEVYETSR